MSECAHREAAVNLLMQKKNKHGGMGTRIKARNENLEIQGHGDRRSTRDLSRAADSIKTQKQNCGENTTELTSSSLSSGTGPVVVILRLPRITDRGIARTRKFKI